jgi:hypothetical protein
LQNYRPIELLENVKENKLSIYERGKVSAENFALGAKLIKGSKPELPDQWYEVLEIMLDQDGFTDQRFKDAVQVMISACPYPKPSHADILSYDKFVDAYTWDELLKITKDYSPQSRGKFLDNYVRVIHYGQERWVLKEEAIKYKLELWKKPKKEEIIIGRIEAGETVTQESAKSLSFKDLAKSFSIQPPVTDRKIFSREERQIRKKRFEEIVKKEEATKNNKVEAE